MTEYTTAFVIGLSPVSMKSHLMCNVCKHFFKIHLLKHWQNLKYFHTNISHNAPFQNSSASPNKLAEIAKTKKEISLAANPK